MDEVFIRALPHDEVQLDHVPSALAERASLFASSLAPTLNFAVNLTIPEELRETAAAAIQEAFDAGIKKEPDEKKRAIAKKVIATLLPIVKAGQIDAAFGIRGAGAGKYTFAFAMKVPDGKAIEQLFKEELVPTIPADQRKFLTLDAATIGGHSVHRVVPPSKEAVDANARRLFGENVSALLAFPNNRVVFALGADADGALKSALETKPPQPAPAIALSASITKIAPLIDQRHAEAAEKLAKEPHSGSDLLTVTVQGGPSLKTKISVKAFGLTFLSKLQESDR